MNGRRDTGFPAPHPVMRQVQQLLRGGAIGLMAGVAAAHADCNPGAARSTPTADFQFEAQGAVVRHAKTALMWERCPEGMTYVAETAPDHSQDACRGEPTTFDEAVIAQLPSAANAGAGRDGYKDWRLPTLEELSSIVETVCEAPAINPVVFPDTPVRWFWADPTGPQPSNSLAHVWGVGFGAGGYYIGDNRFGAVRLVRSAGR